jgi:hypothetical protein
LRARSCVVSLSSLHLALAIGLWQAGGMKLSTKQQRTYFIRPERTQGVLRFRASGLS